MRQQTSQSKLWWDADDLIKQKIHIIDSETATPHISKNIEFYPLFVYSRVVRWVPRRNSRRIIQRAIEVRQCRGRVKGTLGGIGIGLGT
ncbi:MAG: hypothetical protein ACYTF1_15065 [Planctomycetota bacterium]